MTRRKSGVVLCIQVAVINLAREVNVRLRSANRSNTNNVWYVNTSGNVNNNNAYNAYAAAPV